MVGTRRRRDRWVFRAWIVGMLLFAIGLAQDIRPALIGGVLVLSALLLNAVGRAAREIWWPRRPTE